MSKTRDNTPEMDFYELRRRHEEYKRARSAPQPEKNPVEERLERQVAQQKAKPEPAVVVEETPITDAQDTLDVETKAAPMDAFEEAIEENYEAFEDDMDYDEEADEEVVNPNPFDSFIRLFNGMKANRASRRQKDEEFEDLDLEDLTDEELAELEDADLEDLDEDFEDEPAPVKPRFSLRRNVRSDPEEDEEEFDAAEDIEDLDDAPRFTRKDTADEDFDDDDFEGLDDEDFDDEDFDDEDFDDEEAPRKNGFKKFVNLFVARVDEDDEDDEDEDFDDEDFDDDELEDADFDDDDIEEIEEDEEEPVRKGFFSRARKNKVRHEEDEEIYDDFTSEMQIMPEGGQSKMDEMNKLAPETTAQADVIETSGMSRRERRERAMRLAAEEAARKAEEEARVKAEAAPVEPLFADLEVKQPTVDMAAFEDAPETDLIVETTAEEVIETVDEPTREFTPVSMRDVQEAAEKALFDVDDEEDFDDDEDEDDDEEIIEKKPRRGLFGRKRAKDEDEEDDFDEEDDEEDFDDDEDEDDDEEIIEKKPRRGLFGRKRAKDEDEDDEDDFDDEEDEEDDEDLDDDYDDEDDDEYDEYDDDEEDDYDEDDDDDEYDDDYDDDDDEPRRSFGHHLIGVFKIVLALILVLLVLVIGLNFHYFVTGENAILEKTHELLGDSSASDVLCFGYVMRETMPAVEAAPEAAPVVETVVEPTALPQAEVAIPDLNNNGAITETPVVEAAPVIEAAPAVAETPVEAGSIG